MKTRQTLTRLALMALIPATGCNVILHIGRAENNQPGAGNTGQSDGGNRDSGGSDSIAATDGPLTNMHPTPGAHPSMTSASKLDLLFMIDDSSSMAPLQAKMRAKILDFMNVLKNLPGGMPDLHLAAVSSSLGAGKYANIPGCLPNTQGNANGQFQHSSSCTALHPGQSFLTSVANANGGRTSNFDGDIADVFGCIANLGDMGCGFEHQFESVRLALQKSQVAGDVNAGFLRDDAYLAIIMLTNEDDCSVPSDSGLFDPAQQTIADALGGLQSYRCNEFGHRCDQPMPHDTSGLPMTMTGCTSKEDGTLVTVNGFIDFLFNLKPAHPENIFVAAIAGPATPYTIASQSFILGNGTTENQPVMRHSCMAPDGAYADPAVRVKQWTAAFGPNSFVGSICDADFGPTMAGIAQQMVAPTP